VECCTGIGNPGDAAGMGAEFAGFLHKWKQMLRDFPGWKKSCGILQQK